ncbi:MAG: protein disulfide oxidoreductase [Gammaproteobacteria bacterium]|nr:protein disulfide oxidoreductase [Gammaproteobacteria bacterium]
MSKRIKSLLVNILIFFSVYYAVHLYQTRLTPSGTAPEISGWMLEGKAFESLHASSKPVLVHFWATWCKVCKLEQGSINSLSQDYNVITLASQSGSFSEVKKFQIDNDLKFPIIVDQNGSLAKQWGVVGFPSSFVVDENNEIRFVEVGFTTEIGLKLRLWLAKYLA